MTEQRSSGDPLRSEANGWPLVAVIDWIMTEGRLIGEPKLLVEQLCRRLLAVGAPLWRMRLSFQALHPLVQVWSFTWTRNQGHARESRLPHGLHETDAYLGSPIESVHKTGRAVRRRLDRLTGKDHAILHELATGGGIDYFALPMVFGSGNHMNAFIVATDSASGFSAQDLAKFSALSNYLVPVFEAIMARRVAESIVNTYVGRRAGQRVCAGQIRRGDSETIHAAIWFSDLRNFTAIAEQLRSERLLALLNAYFELVTAAVTARGGEVLRFIGDAMLIIFPADGTGSAREVCAAAVESAIDAFDSLAPLNHRRARAGEPPIRFGLGLHVGEVIYGNVGAPDRLDFTVQGAAVNRAARLEGLTQSVGVPVLLSREFADQLDYPVSSLGLHRLKGVAEVQEVFALEAHLSH